LKAQVQLESARSASNERVDEPTAKETVQPKKKPQIRFTVPASMKHDVVDIAYHYLLGSYITGTDFDYLPNMIDQFSSSKSFCTSAQAVALANFARERRDGTLLRHSRTLYVKAIKEVNSALKSDEVIKNSTLVATLILGLFEAILLNEDLILNEDKPMSTTDCLNSWIAHANGTLSLLKFRGKDLLYTDFGKRIFHHVSHKIRANCAQKCIRLPPDLVELEKMLMPLLKKSTLAVLFWPVLDLAIEIKARDKGETNTRVLMVSDIR
jgi:Fungal specific transcription factor domain